MKVVILGNGIAGVTLAQALRKAEPDPDKLEIEIHGREPYDYYARIRLPEVFSDSLSAQDLCLYSMSWYAERSISVHKSHEAVSIDRSRRLISFKDGSRAPYDRLVLAVGADCFVPDLPGVKLAGVRTVREYADADWVRQWIAEGARSMVVVGGGLLGLESARHLVSTELSKVTVLEIADRLLPRQMDERGSAYVKKYMEGLGIECRTGARVESFCGHSLLDSLRLLGGESIETDAAILSMGIAPRSLLAREAGLETRRGIVVDEGMRTSDPDIYAVGDCAEYGGIVWGIIPAAMEQVQVAAARIMGREDARYVQTLPKCSLKVAGIDLLSAGKVNFEPGEESGYEIVLREDQTRGAYQKFVFQDGRLVGAIVLGNKTIQGWCMSHIGKELNKGELPAFS